jgi:serine phosphatase RsbU (regulator of sigma subunit)
LLLWLNGFMKPSIYQLPAEFRAEYVKEKVPFFRNRVGLFCLSSTLIYLSVTAQYGVRQFFSKGDVFRLAEIPYAILLIFCTAIFYFANSLTRVLWMSKACAYAYTILFLFCISAYAVVYYEHGFFFAFYFGCALIMAALMIPWGMREIAFLSLLYTSAFSVYLYYLESVLGYKTQSFPRFHPFYDGLIFMSIAIVVSAVVRFNDIRTDMANFLLRKKIESQTRQIEAELKLADRIHKTLIPASLENDKVEIAVSYIPMSYVGGDCAKFRFLDEDRLIIFISDVTGHGVPAALLVNRVHAEFERLILENPRPAALLKNLNRFIWRDFTGTEMYLSAFCGLLDFKKGTFQFSNYGHPSQYLYRVSSGEVRGLDSQTTLLGVLFDESENHETSIEFKRGDRVLLFTDGVIEAADGKGEFYGKKRLEDFIRRSSRNTSAAFNQELVQELRQFNAGHFGDDLFILSIRTK